MKKRRGATAAPKAVIIKLGATYHVSTGIPVVAELVLRRTSPEIPRPFRTPGLPWVPILGAGFCILQMVALPATTWERLVIWLVLGLIVYFAYGRRSAERARAAKSKVVRDLSLVPFGVVES